MKSKIRKLWKIYVQKDKRFYARRMLRVDHYNTFNISLANKML